MTPTEEEAGGSRRPGYAAGVVIATGLALAAWADLATGWVTPAFDAVAHLFYEVSVIAALRRPSQLVLVRGHLAVLAASAAVLALARPRMTRHARRLGYVLLIGYAVRATAWVVGGNLPLVPGDSCHYLEVSRSVYRGEGPVKHYVESYFRDYPEIRRDVGVLDDWATPLYAYVLAWAYRAVGVEPGASLESTVGVAKGVSFLASLLTLPALYGFARRRFDRDNALMATAILAVLPVHAIYAGVAVREALVGLTSVLAVWTLTEVWSARSPGRSWALAGLAGVCGGLAALGRNTALALLAAAGLYGLIAHGRKRLGPLLLWGVVLVAVIAPWGWSTYQRYGQPFFSYTNYFQYNFSWTVHHYERGNTLASQFYTRANAPEIVRVKLKSVLIIVVTSTMILSLPLAAAVPARIWRGNGTDRLVGLIFGVFAAATLANIADVTQVAQLGRYYMPVFVLLVPTAVAGLRDASRRFVVPRAAFPWLAAGLVALLWADPTWAYDAGWFSKSYQLHWPAFREAGDWANSHPTEVPANSRVLTWFPWEFRVASDRATVLLPRNFSAKRLDEVTRQYGVTHVLWGSFESPPDVEPESWGRYLERLRLGAGLTDDRMLHESPRGLPYPVRLYRLR